MLDSDIDYQQFYEISGNEAVIKATYGRYQEDALVPASPPWGTPFGMSFYASGAPIKISVMARPVPPPPDGVMMARRTGRMRRPRLPDFDLGSLDHAPIDPGPGSAVEQAELTIELYAPGSTQPTNTWHLPAETTGPLRTVDWPAGLPAPGAPIHTAGWWRCVVRATSTVDPIEMNLRVECTIGRAPLKTRTIPKRLLENTFALALEVLAPSVRVEGEQLTIGLGAELADLAGVDPLFFTKDVAPATSAVRLQSVHIDPVSTHDLIEALEHSPPSPGLGSSTAEIAAALAAWQARIAEYRRKVKSDDMAIRISAVFTNATVQAYGITGAELVGNVGAIWLVFDEQAMHIVPWANLTVNYTLAGEIAEAIGKVPIDDEDIDPKIESMIATHERLICGYVRAFIGRALGARGIMHHVRSKADGWHVTYFDDLRIPDVVRNLPGGLTGGSAVPTEPATSIDEPPPPPPPPTDPPPPPPPSTRGTWPPEFIVADRTIDGEGDALANLDRVRTLIFVMMENRSFDHLLGDLPNSRPRDDDRYEGLPADASNPPTAGFVERIRAVPAKSIGLDTQIMISPYHFTKHVLFQMGGGDHETAGSGAMQGFTRDIMTRSDAPQLVMTYYQEAQLPFYYKLVDEYMVCDRWFCSHPGSTWPNRWATLLGTGLPELDNLPVDDERIGFLKDRTIFDVLDQNGIDWRVFESDLSLIRLFDHYRLDDKRVVPFKDPDDGLAATLAQRELPRVIFVEPNFVDIPPVKTANDDHAPAELARGQAFIEEILQMIVDSGKWEDITLVITYDEHGGFYDHVAPPGTPLGGDEWIGKFPRLHPDGPDCLGPRVPSFIVSPYVTAGTICHEVLDHLTIIKTILVHNRDRFFPSTFTSFGSRVNAVPHLGVALDRDTPRPPPVLTERTTPLAPPTTPPTRLPDRPVVEHTRDHRAPDPVRVHRTPTTTSQPASTAPASAVRAVAVQVGLAGNSTDDPDDFHAALKQAFKPRKLS